MITMLGRCLTRGSVLVLLGLSLAGCVPASERINHVIETLPVPSTARLVARQDGVRQGSEDACSFPYAKLLYGTDDSAERVFEFYMTALTSSSWQVWSNEFVSPSSLMWRKEKAFRLTLSPEPDLDFPEEIVASAKSEFGTVYFLVVSFADRLARTKCLGETE